jgi:hypothetical protein
VITASALTRLRNCPSSAVLPRAENHNLWADAGHEAHAELAVFTEDHPFSHLIPAGARAEVKLAYDVALRTGRVIGEGGGRDYGSVGPFEIAGSCDVMGVVGRQVVIIDWKTGHSDVDPAATNWQLWFYALAACRALGMDSALIRIVYTQSGRVDEYEIDALELAEFASSLERMHRQVGERIEARKRGEILETREGSWCKHCTSKHVCPSKTALLVQVSTGGLAVIGDTEMTKERAAGAYEQIVKIEQLVKDARKRLETYVDEQGPIDLGNGRMFGRYSRKGNERLDGAIAVKAIHEVVGEGAKEFESIAIGYTTSKAAIERAAKALVVNGAPKVAKAVIAKVRELGGAKSESTYPIGEYIRGKDEPAPQAAIDTDDLDRRLAEAG